MHLRSNVEKKKDGLYIQKIQNLNFKTKNKGERSDEKMREMWGIDSR